jgi:putative ABC transport system permease protein
MSWLHGTAARLRLLFAKRSAESRIDSELQFHIEMETARLVRDFGVEPGEARRRALAAFGGVEKHREELRDGRGAGWLSGLGLDFTLGLRMLTKSPGLTLVGVLGISVAVTIGALAFTAISAVTGDALPLDEGDRVIAIQSLDARDDGQRRLHVHDLEVWRATLRAVEDVGAYRTTHRNLIPADAPPGAVRVAEMSASGFRLARVAPMRGRFFTNDDEREGAPDVVVIGYDLWQERLGGRADIVGSTVHLGVVRHTVIGVMPKGFAFPMNDEAWTPLRVNPSAFVHGEGPSISVFGRLAPGASMGDARAQLTTIGQRLAAEFPGSHQYIRPRAIPYARTFIDGLRVAGFGMSGPVHLLQVVVGLLLLVIATNVAVLIYARTASRAGEMAVRTALGASRRRIVTQLFVEALVLSGAASIVGLVVAHFVFQRVDAMLRQSFSSAIPYWMRLEVSPSVVVYVAGLAVLAAVIIGVIPGLKATRHRVFENLKDLSGGASMRLGRTWSVLLIAQVAMSVAALPIAIGGSRVWATMARIDRSALPTNAFVIATPLMEAPACCSAQPRVDETARRARYTSRVADIIRQLESEPDLDVVRASPAPGDGAGIRVDLQTATATSDTLVTVRAEWSVAINRVDAGFFGAFELPMLTGRSFTASDFAPVTTAAIVNRAFVERVLGGGDVLGRRVRQTANPAAPSSGAQPSAMPWWEIVGVVENFPKPETQGAYTPTIYLPLRPAEVYPMTLVLRARTLTPAAVTDRVRTVAASVDPTLRFAPIRTLEDVLNDGLEGQRLAVFWLVMVLLSVVMLSAAGMYALMSFTVERRHREIGIRTALGARSSRVLVEILSRAMRQIGIGIGIGILGAPSMNSLLGNTSTWRQLLVGSLQVIAMMLIVGLIASIGPARRALSVQPTEALKAE